MFVGDTHSKGFRIQAMAATSLASGNVLETLQFFSDPGAVSLAIAPFHIRDNALKRLFSFVAAQTIVVMHFHLGTTSAVKNSISHLVRQIAPTMRRGNFEMLGQAIQGLGVIR